MEEDLCAICVVCGNEIPHRFVDGVAEMDISDHQACVEYLERSQGEA